MLDIKKALEVLKNGGVIAHATDTCYGLACDVFNSRALARLYKIKGMSVHKPISILVSSLREAMRYGFFNKTALAAARARWPGPFTIIVKRKKTLSKFFNPKSKTVGIRVPGDALSKKLAVLLGRPITTTSANISGKPPAYSANAVKKQFARQKLKPDFILDSGRLKKTPPSTVIDFSTGKIVIVRA